MRFAFIKGASLLSVAALLSLGPTGTYAGFPDQGKEAEKNGDGRHLAPGGNSGNGAANKKNYVAKGPPPGDDDDEIGVIVKWKDEKGKEDLKKVAKDGKVKDLSSKLKISTLKMARRNWNSIEKNPNIERIEFDSEVHALPLIRGGTGHHPNDEDEEMPSAQNRRRLAEETPYGITMVEADQVPPATNGNPPIKICVIDTGYAAGHVDLPKKLAHNVDGYTPPNIPSGQSWDVDGDGHGTHCAGTIGAIGGNNVGVTSVNPDPTKFSFYIGKGLSDSGSGYTSDILDSAKKCATAGAKIISMSLGGGSPSQNAADIYNDLFENEDVLIIAAAGNGGNTGYSYPASYDLIMSVAAVNNNGVKASFSQWNDQVEIAGPGVSVKSTIPGGYGTKSGTSMATPHVAGVAALVWNHFPQCTANQIRNVLLKTAKDEGDAGCDNKYGYGIVKAKAAYDLLDQYGCQAGGPSAAEVKGGCGRESLLFCESNSDCAEKTCMSKTCNQNTNVCEYNPVDNCCGNDICEAGENNSNCPSDCSCIDDPNCVCHPVTLELTPDNYPGETSWQITDPDSNVVASASLGSYTSPGVTSTEVLCMKTPGEHIFTIYDDWGDGICCDYGSGSYDLTHYYTGEPIRQDGGTFGSEESTTFTITAAPPPSPTVVAETGRQYLSDTIEKGGQHVFKVNFRNQYTDPVVVAFINTRRGGQSVSARIKSVTASSFDLFMQEPDNQGHADEWVSYMVMEKGRHYLEGGIVAEAGTRWTASIHRTGQKFFPTTLPTLPRTDVTFQQPFAAMPSVIHSLMSYNNQDWMSSLVTNVRLDGMKVGLEAAGSGKTSAGERVSYIAMDTGTGTNNGNPFHIGVARDFKADGVEQLTPHVINFGNTFSGKGAPDAVVSLYGERGIDGSWARGSGVWTESQQQVYAEEDQVGDAERKHTDETFAWAAFPANSDIVSDPAGPSSVLSSGPYTPRCGDGLCDEGEDESCPGDCVDNSSSLAPIFAPTTEPPFECSDITSSKAECDAHHICLWHNSEKICCTFETGQGTSCSSDDECCSGECGGGGRCK